MEQSHLFASTLSRIKEQLDHVFGENYPTSLAVAVSGGADSLALTFILNDILGNTGTQLIALTVDHSMRNESAAEAEYVKKILAKKSIKHHTLTWDGEKPTSNKQSEARNIRYSLINEWCIRHNTHYVITAHHYDDQVETFLLRLVRGSGCYGLAAMEIKQKWQNISILRPCLLIRKTEFEDYLKHLNIEWVEDPSNKSLHYDRTFVRNFLDSNDSHLPIDTELLRKRLYNTATNMQRTRNAIEFYVRQFIKEYITITPLGYCQFNENSFSNIPEEIGLRSLSNLLCYISGQNTPPRLESLQQLYQSICSEFHTDTTLHHCRIYYSKKQNQKGDIYISYENKTTKEALCLNKNEVCFDHRFLINNPFFNKERVFYVQYLNKELYNQLDNDSKKQLESIPKHVLYSIPCITHNKTPIMVGNIRSNKLTETADISMMMQKSVLID